MSTDTGTYVEIDQGLMRVPLSGPEDEPEFIYCTREGALTLIARLTEGIQLLDNQDP